MTGKILIEQLKELDSRLFSALDLSFAAFVCRCTGDSDNYPLFLAAALVSNASIKRKYTCLDLGELNGDLNNYFDDLSDFGTETDAVRNTLRRFSIPQSWCAKLCASEQAVAIPLEGRVAFAPLVLDASLLYIYRDWRCEQTLAEVIRERCKIKIKPRSLRR